MNYAALASLARRFAADRTATTAIEYGIIASGVTLAIVGAVVAAGSEVRDNWYQKLYDSYPAQ